MNLWKLAWKNTWNRPWSAVLVLSLLVVGASALRVSWILQEQANKGLSGHTQGVDLVVGAKGSPLQLVLSSVFHIDDPTGNIKESEVEEWMQNPMVTHASKLAYGDGFKGFRILGTDRNFWKFYPHELAQGRWTEGPYEVVLGKEVAELAKLNIGSSFHSVHGLGEEGKAHDHHDFKVVGILQETGLVHDRLIFTPLESVWGVHGNAQDSVKYITAALMKFRNPLGKLQFPRMINGGTSMQAALPTMEAQRIEKLAGGGLSMIRIMAFLLVALSALGLFGNLWQRFSERKKEWELLRTLGFHKTFIFSLIQAESMVFILIGIPTAYLLSSMSIHFAEPQLPTAFQVGLNPWPVGQVEAYIALGMLLMASLAAIIPSLKAYTDPWKKSR